MNISPPRNEDAQLSHLKMVLDKVEVKLGHKQVPY